MGQTWIGMVLLVGPPAFDATPLMGVGGCRLGRVEFAYLGRRVSASGFHAGVPAQYNSRSSANRRRPTYLAKRIRQQPGARPASR